MKNVHDFGPKLRQCREAKGLSQKELAALLTTSHSVIGKYERQEMTPSIEVAIKIAKLLDTTVAYLLGETQEDNLLRNSEMLERLKQIEGLNEEGRKQIFTVVDALIRDFKTKQAFGIAS